MYTYDSKGDIVFIKNLNVDGLSKEVNFEMKYNLKKLPQSTKGIYSFDAGSFKKRKNSTLKQKEEEPLDPNKEYKKGKIVSKVSTEVLASGKDLKKAFAGIKGVQDVIQPMGSNFDKLEPDSGVTLEERGRTKKGQLNSQILGKLSKSDYQQKFSKTMLNFSQAENTAPLPQNSMLGADLFKQRLSQV